MKRIILCADDYGQNTVISQAIIELLQKNRLSATSCMTNSYYWLSHAKWLEPFQDRVDIGLHFNLTEGKPLSKELGADMMPLSQLLIRAYLRQLKQSAIESELHAQIDQFIKALGREPDFLDGHQHIQQLPIVRDAILNVYEKRLRKTNSYIRSVKDLTAFWQIGSSGYLKKLIIQLCGAITFEKILTKNNIPHNTTFLGAYHFKNAGQYASVFPGFLKKVSENNIIMCHPGKKGSVDEDEIADSRYVEYQYFLSDLFIDECIRQKIELSRFK